MMSSEIQYISVTDSRYPERLRQIPDPPQGLYVLGNNLDLLHQKRLCAIVGSRQMTSYGKAVTMQLVKGLVGYGVGIVSGLALGIDGVAHSATIDCGGKTIAVLGCGVDIVAPPSHKDLYKRILLENGLIISEIPPGIRPEKQTFAKRNRIISGLVAGVVIVEAKEKSGSLITAKFAAEQGRDVFAVPGQIYSPLSQGPHTLIQQGAALVTNAEDIFRLTAFS